MKEILVAVDFSDASITAVRQALVLAEALDSVVTLLHVLHVPAEAPGFYSSRKFDKKLFRNMEEAATGMMAEFVGKHTKKAKAKVQTQILPGLPGDETVRQARKLKADLVVIGTRGHSGLKRFLLGSVAEYVIPRRAASWDGACPQSLFHQLVRPASQRHGVGNRGRPHLPILAGCALVTCQSVRESGNLRTWIPGW